MKTCSTCKWWKKQPPGGYWVQEFLDKGMCGGIYENGMRDGAKAETFDHWGDDSGLMTKPDFGCAQHSEGQT